MPLSGPVHCCCLRCSGIPGSSNCFSRGIRKYTNFALYQLWLHFCPLELPAAKQVHTSLAAGDNKLHKSSRHFHGCATNICRCLAPVSQSDSQQHANNSAYCLVLGNHNMPATPIQRLCLGAHATAAATGGQQLAHRLPVARAC